MNARRRFLKAAVLATGGLAAPGLARPDIAGAAPAPPLDPRRLSKFLDEVPRPRRLRDPVLDIPITEFRQRLHGQLPPTTLWGYAGTYPGPTIEAVRHTPTRVTWRNALDRPSLLRALPIDRTLHWADPLGQRASRGGYVGPVPLVTHLHGGETEPASDGHPDAWFTPGFGRKGPGWVKEQYTYHNAQPAATLWYHDHVLGITRLTVYAGLGGFYLLRDPALERELNLPSGDYERELLIQDRSFDVNGQLRYPGRGDNPSVHPYWVPEFFGDCVLVNGTLWPYMAVEPRRYRLILANGSNARFYRLRLATGRPFVQIGADGGFLPAPVEVEALLLAPGERADVVVDFTGLPVGSRVLVTNDAPAPFPEGKRPDRHTVGQVLQFRVVPLAAPDTSAIPRKLGDAPSLGPAAVTRTLTLDEAKGPRGPLAALLNATHWADPVTEQPRLGSTEVWEIANLTADAHPIHLHLVQFQVLNRQAFEAEDYAKASTPRPRALVTYLRGEPRPAEPNERGWKDTVRANPEEVTRIVVRFGPIDGGTYAFDPTAAPGYVWHCHILEHEDNEMMRPLRVMP